ncbi:MAG: hypothetical protein J6A55_01245 [Oscillospiraceae bacterium]|nr:hypothetical protein [Oscillospiraceae bacterium]
MQDKKENKKSQLPVAAVYATALLIGVLVFGLIGFLAVRNFLPSDNSSSEVTEENRFNFSTNDDSITLYAVTDDFDELKSVVLSAFKPSTQNIIIIPLTPYLDCNGQTFNEIYKTHGIADATESVSAKLGVEIDKYMTLSENTLSEVINIMGTSIVSLVDPIVIPDRATGGTVSYQKGARIAVDGDMAVTLIGYPTYASGFSSNMKMSGEIAANSINTFFKQPATAKLNIDLIFNKEYGDANTNMTQDDYNLMKSAIVYVIENSTMPSYSLTPTGEWPEPTRFIIDQSFIDQLDGYLVG